MNGSSLRLVAGCMTGTSLDALDAALVGIRGRGLAMRCSLIGMTSMPLGELRASLASLVAGQPQPPLAFLRAARKLGELHQQAVMQLCEACLPEGQTLSMVVAHGQTIWHAPDESLSWQLMDPWPMVRHLRVPVLYDLRQADLVAQGQGAPITPMADWVLYRDPHEQRLIVNLGGICNVTDLPADCQPDDITGGDIGPCNLLLDGLVSRLYPGQTYDVDGGIAASGRVHAGFGDWVRDCDFFGRPLPHSTGREDFNDAWLQGLLERSSDQSLARQDIIASAADAMARIIVQHRRTLHGSCHIILAGGGAHNATLVSLIRQKLDAGDRLSSSDDLGLPVAAREAMALAVLGALSQDDVPITLPRITGATNPGKAGTWALP